MTSGRWLALIVVFGAALRFVPIWFGLPFPHARPDETVALGLANSVRGGDLNPHFFHWPSLTIYIFAALNAAASAIRRAPQRRSRIDVCRPGGCRARLRRRRWHPHPRRPFQNGAAHGQHHNRAAGGVFSGGLDSPRPGIALRDDGRTDDVVADHVTGASPARDRHGPGGRIG